MVLRGRRLPLGSMFVPEAGERESQNERDHDEGPDRTSKV